MAGSSGWPRPADAPAMDDLARCVHCGLCANACPTYLLTGLEGESPRGRIYLARAVSEGRAEITPAVRGHWERCLQCRACEPACPSGVAYGRIIEHVRAQVAPGRFSFRRFVLRNVVARSAVLRIVCTPARALANSPLRRIARRLGLLRLPGPLARGEAQLPPRIARRFATGEALAEPAAASAEAVLFAGCVMTELFGDVHRATGRVLARAGVRVTAPPGQGCCGALHAHDGDLAFARKLARRLIAVLEREGEAPIVVNSAGCGAAMKDYGTLLGGDARYAERARRFSARVKDFSEYVAELGAGTPGAFSGRVLYQDPCHLAHAQRIREQPRALLAQVAGCELLATAADDTCCGAAGLYTLLQPGNSAALGSRKAAVFRELVPDVVVTANPGCQMQYEAAVREAGIGARVMHLASFLDEAQERALAGAADAGLRQRLDTEARRMPDVQRPAGGR